MARLKLVLTHTNALTNAELEALPPEQKNLINEVTRSELKSSIKLQKASAPGEDAITKSDIQNLSTSFLNILLLLFTACIQLGHYPTPWKSARVTMLHKAGKKWSSASDFRPISLTSMLGKIFERIVKHRLQQFFEDNNMFGSLQLGYRKKHSTLDAIFALTQSVLEAFICKQKVVCCLLDATAAFDKLCHQTLKKQLQTLAIPIQSKSLIESYLENRSVQVSINGVTANSFTPKAGVPQGGILSPILFAFFVADLVKVKFNGLSISQYADDICFWIRSASPLLARKKMQSVLDQISEWCKGKKITLNTGKSEAILFSKGKTPTIPCLTLNNSPIEWSKSVKLLGVHFDEKLSFKVHVKETHTRALTRPNPAQETCRENFFI